MFPASRQHFMSSGALALIFHSGMDFPTQTFSFDSDVVCAVISPFIVIVHMRIRVVWLLGWKPFTWDGPHPCNLGFLGLQSTGTLDDEIVVSAYSGLRFVLTGRVRKPHIQVRAMSRYIKSALMTWSGYMVIRVVIQYKGVSYDVPAGWILLPNRNTSVPSQVFRLEIRHKYGAGLRDIRCLAFDIFPHPVFPQFKLP